MDQASRLVVAERAMGRSEYCLIREKDDELPFPVEHIVSQKHGGSSEIDNLALSCQNCNLHKGTNITGIDSVSGDYTKSFHPRHDQWTNRFVYDGARIEGTTPIGRTTVRVLSMNDADRVELRNLLGHTDTFG